MAANALGAGMGEFLEKIPPELAPPADVFKVLRDAVSREDFTPQDATVVGACLGSARAWLSELVHGPRELVFPTDHGVHFDVAAGWYFLVSNLTIEGGDGGRIAVVSIPMRMTAAPPPVRDRLGWSPLDAQVMESQLRLTIETPAGPPVNVRRTYDVRSGVLGGLELDASPFLVEIGPDALRGADTSPFPMTATYEDEASDLSVQLVHTATEPLFLQGTDGYVPASGGAGYLYYSVAQLRTTGTIVYQGESYAVSGPSWFDHQWGAGAAEPREAPQETTGWVWFAFNLDNGTAITLSGGHGPPPVPDEIPVTGKLVAAGSGEAADITGTLTLTDRVTSPYTGSDGWPAGWQFQIDLEGTPWLEITAVPWATDQFGMFSSLVEYWEGGVDVTVQDLRVPATVQGVGFCESVGFEPTESYGARALAYLAQGR
jgi:predicted secreted hydrolase